VRNQNYLVSLVSILFALTVSANDVSNSKKEESLNQIYKTYNAQPTDQVIWSLVAGQSGVRTYKTQKGDTLWDISEMLFGDGFFWSKVWSLNPEITNPHDVPPGTVLSFYHGSLSDAPILNLDKQQPEALPEVLALTLNAEIPPPLKESAPPLNSLPDSFPQWKFKKDTSIQYNLDLKKPRSEFPSPNQYLSYYAAQEEVQGEGEVLGAELGMESASEHQYVFVKANAHAVGQTLLAVKNLGEVEDPYSSKKATLVQVQGLLQLIEAVDSEKGAFRALVKRTIAPIEKGAKLLSGDFPSLNMTDSGSVSQASARVFGGQFGLKRRIFGPDGILFLNQGSRSGLSEGQVLNVFKSQAVRTENSPVRENPRIIGKVKVVRTTEDFSTAVVLSALEEIRVGDGTSAESVSAQRSSD